ncbi:tetratricopeptide repeat protein [Kiloniella laminariae]|uniref:Tetratricopeptide repeat protein n=1 Tax=Kiloniella laminariae TaxID=454162 RepID=A0ABT4LFD5_9PROT|nr:tetratricopeptide repeat protein [Kiloniella laminariae]MCZ4279645.1 tetratricopeptide repeat protein [Kiloniella laminariae]
MKPVLARILVLLILLLALVSGWLLLMIPDDNADAIAALERGDKKEAFALYKTAAQKGDRLAQTELGIMYNRGTGTLKNQKEAFKWLSKAAEGGQGRAQYYLAHMYSNGYGTEQDNQKALFWYQKAADKGIEAAYLPLGLMHLTGKGPDGEIEIDTAGLNGQITLELSGELSSEASPGENISTSASTNSLPASAITDPRAAFPWLKKAAELGRPEAEYLLGLLYQKGEGLPNKNSAEENMEQAVFWFERAAKSTHVDAQYALAQLFDDRGSNQENQSQAFRWYQQAANQGHPRAQYRLGTFYRDGKGTLPNDWQAATWFSNAANRGFLEAQFALGELYQSQNELGPDYTKAYMWFGIATLNGHEEALERKNTAARQLQPEARAAAEKLIADWQKNRNQPAR